MKFCTDCSKTKNLSEFYGDKRNKSGLGSYCKQCSYQRSQISKHRNRAKYRDYMRKYMRAYRSGADTKPKKPFYYRDYLAMQQK